MTTFSGGCNSALQEATVSERGLLTCAASRGLDPNKPHMAAHKFRVGQSVRFTPGKMTPPAGGQAYTIVRALPARAAALLAPYVGDIDHRAAGDGEVVASNADGSPNFARLHVRWTRPATLRLWAFDLLAFNGRDLRLQPLVKRAGLATRSRGT